MGWNDHIDDSELGNLPPEAFSPFDVDGPFDPQDHWLETADEEEQRIAMREWFLARFCDPADRDSSTTVARADIFSLTEGLTILLMRYFTVFPVLLTTMLFRRSSTIYILRLVTNGPQFAMIFPVISISTSGLIFNF